MSNAQAIEAASISEPLSWKEICQRWPDEWVCLVEIEWVNDTDFDFGAARMVGHGKSRKEAWSRAESWWATYNEIGHFFTGRVRSPVPRFFA